MKLLKTYNASKTPFSVRIIEYMYIMGLIGLIPRWIHHNHFTSTYFVPFLWFKIVYSYIWNIALENLHWNHFYNTYAFDFFKQKLFDDMKTVKFDQFAKIWKLIYSMEKILLSQTYRIHVYDGKTSSWDRLNISQNTAQMVGIHGYRDTLCKGLTRTV